ncbi:MAG: hypothetical protein ACPG4K_00630 [Haloferula sp.]
MSNKGPEELSADEQSRLFNARVLRLTFGVVASTAAAYGIGWPLAFITPVLVVSFLAAPAPRPTFGALLAFPIIILAALSFAFGVSVVTSWQPVLLLLVVMLMIFRCFYLMSIGVARGPLTWVLMGFLMIPAMAVTSLDLALALTKGLFGSGLIAMGFVWLSHAFFPDPVGVSKPAKASPPELGQAERNQAAKMAFLRMLVILPLQFHVMIGQNTDDLKILIFATMLIQSPSLSAGLKGGKAMIMGNTFGGVAAMIVYELLVLFPSYFFLLILFAFVCLVFGRQIFTPTKWGPLCGAGLNTVVLLIGLGTMPFGDETDDQFYSRIWQVILAAVYVVFAYHLVAYVTHWNKLRQLKKTGKLQQKAAQSA